MPNPAAPVAETERAKCACVRRDAYDCWAARYNLRDDGFALESDHQEIEMDGGPCECSCHDHEDGYEW